MLRMKNPNKTMRRTPSPSGSKHPSPSSMRRFSPRLRHVPDEKRPYYGSPNHRKRKQPPISPDHLNLNPAGEEDLYKWLLPSSPLIHAKGIAFVRGLRDTLRLFNLHYTLKQRNDNVVLSKSPDLKPLRNPTPQQILGPIPGLNVGFQFLSRAEMVAVGMHVRWSSGIDYIANTRAKKPVNVVDNGYSFPLAVAIVLSGQYEDDVDNSEDIVYTAQPAPDFLANTSQIQYQVLTCDNLALKNSMKHSTPIRVIRGHKCANSYTEKIYTYDGLFQVVDYWAEKDVAGFTVFKCRLKRLPGQPNLVPNEVHFLRGQGSSDQSAIPGLVCKDISNGKEIIPIPVTNLVDDPPVAPAGFTYMTSIEIAKGIKIPSNARGCKCKEKCTDPETCYCAKLNCSDFPYVIQNGGRLIEPKDVVFECGPNCGCGIDCINRTSQRGLKFRLEVYRTFDKGWGVRSWDYIPSGAPVCEYIGVLRKSDDLDNVMGNEFIFEIDCLQTINEIGDRERRFRDVSLPSKRGFKRSRKISESAAEYCLDAGSKGNVARFINHSCEPNLFVQCVLSSHRDLTLARIVLFAADNIVPLQELTYDYAYELDSVVGSDGKIKKLACFCGATCCRRRLY